MAVARAKRLSSKLKPRSQSLGSLSVISPNSPAKYEPITNIPMRMAASFEANNNQGFMHDLSEFVKELTPPLRFVPSKLRRSMSHGSILVRNELREQEEDEYGESKFNNNNHIYADLDLKEDKEEPIAKDHQQDNQERDTTDQDIEEDVDVDTETDTEIYKLDEQQVVIEINILPENMDVESVPETMKIAEDQTKEITVPNPEIAVEVLTKSEGDDDSSKPAIPEIMQNSIDAHLDKIDELNRTLDNRLKRTISPPQITDLDAIESAEIIDVITRPISGNPHDIKRISTSSSDRELPVTLQNDKNKKRSLSFSQKSINAILCNIKEFSKSPLTKMHKSLDSKDGSPEKDETGCFNAMKSQGNDHKIQEGTNHQIPNASAASNTSSQGHMKTGPATTSQTTVCQSETQQYPHSSSSLSSPSTQTDPSTTSMEPIPYQGKQTATTTTNTAILNPSKDSTSKLKFKVPKIQKKSKAIRQTFRSKFINFQLRKGKLCKICTKRRRIHPSKSVFDFAKEFNLNSETSEDNSEEFCTCPVEHSSRHASLSPHILLKNHPHHHSHHNSSIDDDDGGESSDDVLSMKDHCYCVPSLATTVSNI